MNPWKIIGWIVLAGIILMLGLCSLAAYQVGKRQLAENAQSQESGAVAPQQPVGPKHSVEVVNVSCEQNYSRPKASITVRNTGETAIEYAKVYVKFTRKDGSVASAEDSYLRPSTIPPGSLASANTFSAEGADGIVNCGLEAVQDRDGNPVAIK